MEGVKIPLPEVTLTRTQLNIKEMMDEHRSVFEISKKLQKTPESVMAHMCQINLYDYAERRKNMEIKNAWTTEMVDKAVEMYNAGRTCREIGQEIGKSEGSVAVKLSTMRKNGTISPRVKEPVEELLEQPEKPMPPKAEQKPVQAEQKQPEPEQNQAEPEQQEPEAEQITEEPVQQKQSKPIPEVVIRSVKRSIAVTIASIGIKADELRRLKENRAQMEAWLTENGVQLHGE